MAKRILVVQGHPDPHRDSLCKALGEAYITGARSGDNVRSFDVGAADFPLLRDPDSWQAGAGSLPDELRDVADDLLWAQHLMIIYPLWLGTMPALLKAFFEQVFRPGVALDENPNGFPQPLLKGHSARIVITMGMPVMAYRWYFRAHSLKNLERNILNFVGVRTIRETLFGMVGAVKPATRGKWIEKMERLGARDAS